MPSTLYIFDFDGTLFNSPEPNPRLWHSNIIGKLRESVNNNGLGWYQDVITLSEPYLPRHPCPDTSAWWVKHVHDECKRVSADRDCVNVLLTGRNTLYRERITEMVLGAGLRFDYLGFKPLKENGDVLTFEFKCEFISDIIKKMKGDIKRVVLYEDRPKHVQKFQSFLITTGLEFQIHQIPQKPGFFQEEHEKEIVKHLLSKHAPHLTLVEHIDYTLLKLNNESHKCLLRSIPPPLDWVVKAHHMTISHGSVNVLGAKYTVGDTVEVEVVAVGFSEKALAVQIRTDIRTQNKIAHVTIAHAPDARPADSNFIQNWLSLEKFKTDPVLLMETARPKGLPTSPNSVISNNNNDNNDRNHTSSTILNVEQPLLPTQHAAAMIITNFSTSQLPSFMISGIITEYKNYGLTQPPPKLTQQELKAVKGVSFGETIKKFHPHLKGKDIGDAVKIVREWVVQSSSANMTLEMADLEKYVSEGEFRYVHVEGSSETKLEYCKKDVNNSQLQTESQLQQQAQHEQLQQ